MKLTPFYRILPYIACLFACSAVNIIYFPTTLVFPDEQRIFASAVKFAATGEFWVGGDRAWEMPGAAMFFAPWVRLLGEHHAIIAIRFAQSVLLLAQCGLIASLTRRVTQRENAAYFATCVTALYPFFLFYQGLLLSETLFNTLLLAGLAGLYAWRERGAQLDAMFGIALTFFAAATLTKATLTILPPLLFAIAVWTAGASLKRTLIIMSTASCLYAALLSPWSIRNKMVLGALVPLTTSNAQNLYLGNNPNNPQAGIDWSRDVEPDIAARIFAIPNEIERQRAFSERAIDYIKTHPGLFLEGMGKKFVRFWSAIPNTEEFRGIYAWISAISFGPVLVFAIAGVLRQWRSWQQLAPLVCVIGYFTVIHIITIASLRYRLPIEPLLIILAAEPAAALIAWLRQRTAMSGSSISPPSSK